jgi:hypothetical protein
LSCAIGIAPARKERLQAQLITLPHRGIDLRAGQLVDPCLVLALSGILACWVRNAW